MSKNNLILGGGYVGARLAKHLHAPMTHRAKDCAAPASLYFDLADRNSWDNLPSCNQVIWTFPATPLHRVQALYQAKFVDVDRLIVYASTSCYQPQDAAQKVDENHPLDFARERIAGEEWLREQGATILVLAGIYGPNRQPSDWLKRGLIKTPNKRVNLIHVDDIVAITERVLMDVRNPRGERFNLCDGAALLWRDIAGYYGISLEASATQSIDKRVSNDKIRDWLGGYRFRSLF